jgi:hypothetical protein
MTTDRIPLFENPGVTIVDDGTFETVHRGAPEMTAAELKRLVALQFPRAQRVWQLRHGWLEIVR